MARKKPSPSNNASTQSRQHSPRQGFSRGVPWELRAQAMLEQQGLRLLERNFRARGGEIDLIMVSPENTIVFVEVRQRAQRYPSLQLLDERRFRNFGSALESITPAKIARIKATAELFLQSRRKMWRRTPICRFDVVTFDGSGAAVKPNWIRNAF